MPTPVNVEPPYTFPPNLDYPVSLATYHFLNTGVETPVSGDQKYQDWQERKVRRQEELKQFPIARL